LVGEIHPVALRPCRDELGRVVLRAIAGELGRFGLGSGADVDGFCMLGTSSSGDARVNLFREARNRQRMILENGNRLSEKIMLL
jgi:hypothetical protein